MAEPHTAAPPASCPHLYLTSPHRWWTLVNGYSTTEFLVSKSGQISVPAGVRRRGGLTDGSRVTVIDLGDAVVLLPPGARNRFLDDALSREGHLAYVTSLDDPDLATT